MSYPRFSVISVICVILILFFFVISLFLFRAVVNCKRHFAISVTVVTMMTVFVG